MVWLVDLIYLNKNIPGRKRLFSTGLAPYAQPELISSRSPLITALLHQINLGWGIRKKFAVCPFRRSPDQLHCFVRLLCSAVEKENTPQVFFFASQQMWKIFLYQNNAATPELWYVFAAVGWGARNRNHLRGLGEKLPENLCTETSLWEGRIVNYKLQRDLSISQAKNGVNAGVSWS